MTLNHKQSFIEANLLSYDQSQIQALIKDSEQPLTTLGSKLESDKELTSGNPPRLNQLIDLSEYPKPYQNYLQRFLTITDELFDALISETAIHPNVRQHLETLRAPFWLYFLTKPHALLSAESAGKALINALIKIALLWEKNDPKSTQIEQQFEYVKKQLFSAFASPFDIAEIVEQINQSFQAFTESVLKRIEIFEKRVREAEEGQAKARIAKDKTEQVLQQLLSIKALPEFISTMLSSAWQHVIFLEVLKTNDEKKAKSIFVAKSLIVSLQPMNSIDELEKFLAIQPELYDQIKAGLEKSSLSFAESAAFMEELDAFHQQLLDQVKVSLEKAPKEEILRLKPTNDPYQSATTEETPEQVDADIEALSPPQWVNYVFDTLESSNEDNKQQSTDVQINSRRERERKASERLFKLLKPGRWFSIKDGEQNLRCKLSVYIEALDKYIFVNSTGSKVAERTSEDLIIDYQNGHIEILKNAPLFERAFSVILESMEANQDQLKTNDSVNSQQENTVSERVLFDKNLSKNKKSQTDQEVKLSDLDLDSVDIDQDIADENIETIKEATDQAKTSSPPTDEIVNTENLEEKSAESDFDPSMLSEMAVGSWVEIKVGYKMKKCRLAAKIASTQKLIFTDRSGIKVKECHTNELEKLFSEGLLQIDKDNTIFDKAFSSVISNMRSMKANE